MTTAQPPLPEAHAHRHNDDPSPWIVRFAHLVRPGSSVLDVAAGHGRHARLFAARGCQVVAVDNDRDALSSLGDIADVTPRGLDLEAGGWPLQGERFDAVVVTHYLHRPTWAELLGSVAAHGVLLYETFMQGHERYGRPCNPDFLLQPDELLNRCAGRLRVVAFEQGDASGGARCAVLQRIVAAGPRFQWPARLAAA